METITGIACVIVGGLAFLGLTGFGIWMCWYEFKHPGSDTAGH